MELLVILCTLISASFSQPIVKTWTLNELSAAIENNSNEALQPYLVDALNQIMYALFTGSDENVHAIIPSPTGEKIWTKKQLKKAIDDPETNPVYQPFLVRALHQMHNQHNVGNRQKTIEVTVPALDISVWNIVDLQQAKDDPSTKPELLPYLKKVENKIMEALKAGEDMDKAKATLVTPVGLVPVKNGTIPEIIPRNTLL